MNKNEEKIIKTILTNDYEIFTDTGWHDLQAVHKTIPYKKWGINTKNHTLFCADLHKVINKEGLSVFIKDCKVNDEIKTISGIEKIISCECIDNNEENMYDVTVDSNDHTLYTNGILSKQTTLMTVYALWLACFEADKHVVIVANKARTAIKILRKIQLAYIQLPNWLKPGIKNFGKIELIFGNDSVISIDTTTGSASRGDAANCLIIDEFAHIKNNLAEEFWTAVMPIISSSKKSKIFIVSTPKGTSNKFYELYSKAEKGEVEEGGVAFKSEKIDWWEVPGRDEQWKKTMIHAMGQAKFDQEFGNVFTESGETAVDRNLLEEFKKNCDEPLFTYENGSYKIWNEPKEGRIYAIGVDVSEGIGKASSVAQILDFTDLSKIDQVGIYSNNKVHPAFFAEILHRICEHWGNPPILIERNNCGAEVITILKNTFNYYNIVQYTSKSEMNSNSRCYEDRLGIYCSTQTKTHGVLNMRYWINTLKCLQLHDIITVKELETFVRYPNGTWKHDSGIDIFDDHVMSLLWGLFLLEKSIVSRYYNIAELDDNGMPSRINSYVIDEQSKSRYKLDDLFQKTPGAPLPSVFNMNIFDDNNDEIKTLLEKGWTPATNFMGQADKSNLW